MGIWTLPWELVQGSAGTHLIGSRAQDLDEHRLIRAQALHGLLQLPGGILAGVLQKGQGCLLEASTQLLLEHLLQVLWEDSESLVWEHAESRGTGVCSPHRRTPAVDTRGTI